MILHFVVDEKVTDQIIENFNKANENNSFLVFGNRREENFQHITKSKDKLIKFIIGEDDINKIIKQLDPKAILLHALHIEYAKAIIKIKTNLTIAWYPWGFDIYGLPRIKPSTYALLTNEFLLKKNPGLFFRRIALKYKFLRKIYFRIDVKNEDRYSIIFSALKRVVFFVTYIENDFNVFSSYYTNQMQFVNCPFSTIDQYLSGNRYVQIEDNAKNILVGNSNSPESNHLDVFKRMSKDNSINDFKIFTPLSYGNNIEYQSEVLNKGREILGNSFIPLLKFMKRSDYILLLRSCSVGIFYHYRQQAMGNIIAMLYIGARIYMSSKNPAYHFFKKNEIKIFDFDKDYSRFQNKRLEDEIIVQNKRKLGLIFNEEKVLTDIRNLTELLCR
ncbi:TDP-N-acetylfucosamine:lipid II N-acetylfucosaminyltransferase [Aquimarina algiphila]|uniref:TDP-N-acetylfucosamine:lipid II N-acetylfucosaminyltransferase n=1 Tax=Aquimarina algiphila TaxID=2047982 RepID=UPI00232BA805|nr:TDP-N-acetylfucosamine:lipid II N-acetylfucosaminyltransferase [Aquimarina algiphila]